MNGHQPAAGVGTAAKHHTAYKLIEVPLTMEASKVYYTAGRLSNHRLVVPGAHYLVYNIYGYTNSHTDPAQRAKHSRLFDAVLPERTEDGLIPAALLGDFNCELQDIPAIYDLMQEGNTLTSLPSPLRKNTRQTARGYVPGPWGCVPHQKILHTS